VFFSLAEKPPVRDANEIFTVKSELHQEIDRRFREKKIEIAFPQRDLHLRSLDESAILHTSENVRSYLRKEPWSTSLYSCYGDKRKNA
jgi:small-conductance mechanosensitive channel